MQEIPRGQDQDSSIRNESLPQAGDPLAHDPSTGVFIRKPETGRKKSRKGLFLAVGASTLLALGIGVGLKSMNNTDEKVPHVGPVATAPIAVKTEQAPPTSSETTRTVEAKKSLETFFASFDISADKYKTPEAVTVAYIDRHSKWLNTGLTVGQYSDLYETDVKGMVSAVESKYDTEIINKLYTGSEAGRSLASSIQTGLRTAVIQEFWMSESRSDKNLYEFKDELTSAKLVSSDNADFAKATTFTVRAISRGTDNGNLNVAQNRIEHGVAAQIDITRDDLVTFALDSATNTWKVDSSYLQKSYNNSK